MQIAAKGWREEMCLGIRLRGKCRNFSDPGGLGEIMNEALVPLLFPFQANLLEYCSLIHGFFLVLLSSVCMQLGCLELVVYSHGLFKWLSNTFGRVGER